MVDLNGQYNNIKDQVDLAIQTVINNSAFIKGPDVKAFEEELADYLGVQHVIGCANGTDALQIGLMALDLKPGDEVITPDFTFISTVEVGAILKLKPILVDVDPLKYTLTPESVKNAITPNTKAIVPVHLYGQCADMEAILQIANEHGIPVIEDAAQALGAEYTFKNGKKAKACNLGDIGCTSFFPSKNLGCYGDGGAITTNNAQLAEKIRAMANHGMKVKYYNDYIGINSRLDTMQAAILRVKLQKLDEYNNARQEIADAYDNAFSPIEQLTIPSRNQQSTHVFHQYTILLASEIKREDFQPYLKEKGIPSMIYYPVPMHQQRAYSYLNNNDTDFPVTNNITKRVISLPMHTEMDQEQIAYITSTIKAYFN